MKQYLIIALCFAVLVPAIAFEMTEEQKKILEAASDKMLTCLDDGQKEQATLQQKYDDAKKATEVAAAKPKHWYSDPVKGPKKAENKALTELKTLEAKLAVIKANLKLLGKREMTEEELKAAKGELYGYMILEQKAMDKAFPKLEKANKEAVARLERIPSEKAAVEESIKEHQAKIAELEASKEGKGMLDKGKINAVIVKEKGLLSMENGKPAKLDAEAVEMQKVIAKFEEALVKKTALDVAIAYLNSGEAVVLPTIEIDEEEVKAE